MSFKFNNLTEKTRRYMVEEVNYDIKNKCLYISERLSYTGKLVYVDLLLKNI